MNDYIQEILFVITVAIVFFYWGYKHGKINMLAILKVHVNAGRTLPQALEYEQDVENGVVPRG